MSNREAKESSQSEASERGRHTGADLSPSRKSNKHARRRGAATKKEKQATKTKSERKRSQSRSRKHSERSPNAAMSSLFQIDCWYLIRRWKVVEPGGTRWSVVERGRLLVADSTWCDVVSIGD